MALALSRYFQSPSVHFSSFNFTCHPSFPTSTYKLFSMLLSSNEPSAITVSIPSFKMLPSNLIYHLFFMFRTCYYLRLIEKNSIIKKILRKNTPIQICKCHCTFFCFGNFTSSWFSVFIISITECPERPGPIFAVSVNHLEQLNLDPRKCLRVWPSVNFEVYHVSQIFSQ